MQFPLLAVASILLSSLIGGGYADHNEDFEWATLSARIPKAISDHTASYSSDNGLIYLVGGCDSPRGNEFAGEYFFCATISDVMYIFNPTKFSIADPVQLPRARYRHCTEIINNQLWIVGGRDDADNLIAEVDVYDIASGQWSSFTLPEAYHTSDHACFSDGSFMYIVGGYTPIYEALSAVNRIDTSSASSTLVVEEMEPLTEARGDITAATDGSTAYITGGFTDTNGFCAPLTTAEQYDIAGNSWSSLPEMDNERGEIVMVEMGDHIYAMGGERQIEGICELTGTTDPGELTVGMEVVEVLENNLWNVLDSFDDHKFRFAAVGVNGLIYAFGGQTAWDGDCECFRTTDDIQILGDNVQEVLQQEQSANPPDSAAKISFLCGVMTTLTFAVLGFML